MSQRYAGQKKLWVKVIIRAIYDYVLYQDKRQKVSNDRLYREASAWIFSDHPVNSLNHICELVDLCPDPVRSFVLRDPKPNLAKLRLAERKMDQRQPGFEKLVVDALSP